MSRTDSAKEFKVKNMGASESFNFNGKDFEQALIYNNHASVSVTLRDNDSNDFTLSAGASFELSMIPSKALTGLTVITGVGGTCSIAYVQ